MTEAKNVEMTSLAEDHPDMKCGLPAERYDQWMADAKKRKDAKPFDERRIGWIARIPDYKVCCCGQSARDLFLIIFILLVFYGVNALLVWLFWMVASIDLVAVSYIYGGVGLVFLVVLFTLVSIKGKSVENAYLEALAEEN